MEHSGSVAISVFEFYDEAKLAKQDQSPQHVGGFAPAAAIPPPGSVTAKARDLGLRPPRRREDHTGGQLPEEMPETLSVVSTG